MKEMSIGERIKQRREERGLTRARVGDLCGVGENMVRGWEDGNLVTLGATKINALCAALRMMPDELLGWGKDIAQGEDAPINPMHFSVSWANPVPGKTLVARAHEAIILTPEEVAPPQSTEPSQMNLSPRSLLGKWVQDKITCFEGIVTGEAQYLFEGAKCCVAAKAEGGKMGDECWIDAERLIVMGKGFAAMTRTPKGGD